MFMLLVAWWVGTWCMRMYEVFIHWFVLACFLGLVAVWCGYCFRCLNIDRLASLCLVAWCPLAVTSDWFGAIRVWRIRCYVVVWFLGMVCTWTACVEPITCYLFTHGFVVPWYWLCVSLYLVLLISCVPRVLLICIWLISLGVVRMWSLTLSCAFIVLHM